MGNYLYDGKMFTSLKALSKYCGVYEKTISYRIHHGMTLEEACVNKKYSCNYSYDDSKEKSLIDLCKDKKKDIELVQNRLSRGYTIQEALNKPKKVTKQGKSVLVDGTLYNSVSEACRELKLEVKESTIRRRLLKGWNADDAFKF